MCAQSENEYSLKPLCSANSEDQIKRISFSSYCSDIQKLFLTNNIHSLNIPTEDIKKFIQSYLIPNAASFYISNPEANSSELSIPNLHLPANIEKDSPVKSFRLTDSPILNIEKESELHIDHCKSPDLYNELD